MLAANIETWKAEKHREWQKWVGINDGSPITTAWRTQNAACERLVEAAAELNTRPTTVGRAPAISAAEARGFSLPRRCYDRQFLPRRCSPRASL